MKKILALAFLLPSLAFAQGVASSSPLPRLSTNQKLCFDGAACTKYLYYQGSIMYDGLGASWRLGAVESAGPLGPSTVGCDSSASPGNATCNDTWSGIAAVALGAGAATITSNQATAARKVFVVLRANDTTCTSVKSVAVNAGNFVVTLNANCTAATAFSWFLVK